MELILEGSDGTAEFKAHIAKCEKCAGMARQWHSLKLAGEPKSRALGPSPDIDARIYAAAVAKTRELRRRRLFLRVVSGLAAAAALVAITLSMALYLPGSQDAVQQGGFLASARGKSASPSAQSGISWDSVALADGLLKLNSEIESASSSLSSLGSKKEASQSGLSFSDQDASSLQAILVDVPDFAT
jgi:hypothetical protein